MPSTNFVGPSERTIVGGNVTAQIPLDGSLVHKDGNGNELLSFLGSGTVKLNGTILPATFSFTTATNGSNVCEVTVQAKDSSGTNMARTVFAVLWLSDSAAGTGVTATTASGAVAAKASSGTDFAVLTTKKAILIQTKADGSYILSITDSAKTAFYVCANTFHGGAPSISTVLASASYG